MVVRIDGTLGISALDGNAIAPGLKGANNYVGVYFPAANTLAISSSATERMRIASDGRVGIGTDTPTIQYGNGLQVKGIVEAGIRVTCASNTGIDLVQTSSGLGGIFLRDNAAMTFSTSDIERMRIDANGNIGINQTAPTSYGKLSVFTESADSIDLLYLQKKNTTTFRVRASSAGVTTVGSPFGDSLAFEVNASEKMRITSTSKVGIGTASPNGFLTVTAGNWAPYTNFSNNAITLYGGYGGGISFIDSSDPNSGIGYAIWTETTGANFHIAKGGTGAAATGGVYINNGATSWTARSDERDKTNLIPITDALDKLSTLRTVMGEYIWSEGIRHPFLIAQDVQQVIPEAVSTSNQSAPEEEQRLGVSYTDMIPIIIAAIKELKTELDTVKAELAALKAQ